RRNPLHHNAAKLIQVDKVSEFLAIAESAAGREHRVLKVHASDLGLNARDERRQCFTVTLLVIRNRYGFAAGLLIFWHFPLPPITSSAIPLGSRSPSLPRTLDLPCKRAGNCRARYPARGCSTQGTRPRHNPSCSPLTPSSDAPTGARRPPRHAAWPRARIPSAEISYRGAVRDTVPEAW